MVTDELRITAVQLDVSWEAPELNFVKIEKLLENSQNQSDLILLPEMFNTGFTLKPHKVASSMDGEAIQWMRYLASMKNAVIAGSIVVKDSSQYFNRFIAMYPDGKMEWYDKRHLFRMGGEEKSYTSGKIRKIIEIKGWKCAMFVCYDLRFPVWSRSVNQYDVALYVANWPQARIFAWKTLIKARAIENQCYVVGVNRVGKDGLGNYSGNSMVVDYKGQCIAGPAKPNESLIDATLSLNALNEFKKSFPAWMDADKFNIEDVM